MNQKSYRGRIQQFSQDLIFFAPGLIISAIVASIIFSLVISVLFLIPVLLIGVLLIPAIMIVGGLAADLSRIRLNYWLKANRYAALGKLKHSDEPLKLVSAEKISKHRTSQSEGFSDTVKLFFAFLTNHRLWLDTLFESILALAWRLVAGMGYLFYVMLAFGIFASLIFKYPLGYTSVGLNLVELIESIDPGLLAQFSSFQLALAEIIISAIIGALMLIMLVPLTSWLARREAELIYTTLNPKPNSTSLRAWGAGVLISCFPLLMALFVIIPSDYLNADGIWIFVTFGLLLGLIFTPRYPKLAVTFNLTWSFVVLTAFNIFIYLFVQSAQYENLSVNQSFALSTVIIFAVFNAAALYSLQLFILAAIKKTKTLVVMLAVLSLFAVVTAITAYSNGFEPFKPFELTLSVSAVIVMLIMASALGFGFNWLVNMARQTRHEQLARAQAEEREAAQHAARQEAESVSAISQARSAELIERTRIAREMHDVVAHSMSVISVQAKSAPYRLAASNLDEATVQEFNTIAHTAKLALQEMRSLLGVLRGADDVLEPIYTPQPSLCDLPALIEQSSNSGAKINFQSNTDLALIQLPPTLALAIYRTAQEGISNALRHAPGAEISLNLEYSPQLITLTITNELVETTVSNSNGHGLKGIAERVSALGGQMSAQNKPDATFELKVAIEL